jgi:3-hydroxy acid dehydrogenase/malonic semialdehyde reductase
MMFEPNCVFITGASSGIGEATAIAFAKRRANLILVARRADRLSALKQSLESTYAIKVHTITLDIRDKAAVQAHIQSIPESFFPIDLVINNAGLAREKVPLQEGKTDDWDTMIDTNIKGLLYITKALLPQMIKNNHGHIINVGSVAGQYTYPDGNVYSATKFAVRAITESLRLDLFNTDIRVSEIAPGAVETEFSAIRYQDPDKAKQFYDSFTPLQPDDIANAIVFMATQPKHVNISQITLWPTCQASINHIRMKDSS